MAQFVAGPADSNTRYYLIALKPNAGFTDGDYYATKGLWALGNFSRWIRPGMRRVLVGRSDGKDDIVAAQDVMVLAYTDGSGVPDRNGRIHGGRIVVVAINYTTQTRVIRLNFRYAGHLAPRSVTTFVMDTK